MQVIERLPPIYSEILAAFPAIARMKPIFSWGSTIYNPHRIAIDDGLMAHEGVHAGQQGSNPEAWWRTYIASPKFRLQEELAAHRVEYQWRAKAPGMNRHQRRALLVDVAKRLSSPMYGSMISLSDARAAIAGGV